MGHGTLRNSATHQTGRDEPVGSAGPRDRRSPGAAGLGWVGLALAVLGVALVALLPLALGSVGDRSARLIGYLALLTAAFTTVAGIVFDRARTPGLIGLVLALVGFVLVATLPT